MSIDPIHWLKFINAGGDPEALFQRGLACQLQTVEETTRAAAAYLSAKQAALECQSDALLERVEALDIAQLGMQDVEASHEQIKELQSVQHMLQQGLSEESAELKRRQRSAAHLTQELQKLQTLLRKTGSTSSPLETFLLEAGQTASKHIGKKPV